MKNQAREHGTRPYRMGARAEAVAATREGILDAATAVFWQAPSDELSLDDVAVRAGVSVRTVLRHFETREGLFEAAAQREADRIAAQRASASPGDVTGAVRVLVNHYEDVGEGVLRLLAEEQRTPGLQAIVDRGRDSHWSWCRRVFADALAPLSGVDRDRRLAQFVVVCDVYCWKLLRMDAGLSRRQTERAITELLAPLLEVP